MDTRKTCELAWPKQQSLGKEPIHAVYIYVHAGKAVHLWLAVSLGYLCLHVQFWNLHIG